MKFMAGKLPAQYGAMGDGWAGDDGELLSHPQSMNSGSGDSPSRGWIVPEITALSRELGSGLIACLATALITE